MSPRTSRAAVAPASARVEKSECVVMGVVRCKGVGGCGFPAYCCSDSYCTPFLVLGRGSASAEHRAGRAAVGVRGADGIERGDELLKLAFAQRRHCGFVGGVDEWIDLVEELPAGRRDEAHHLPPI